MSLIVIVHGSDDVVGVATVGDGGVVFVIVFGIAGIAVHVIVQVVGDDGSVDNVYVDVVVVFCGGDVYGVRVGIVVDCDAFLSWVRVLLLPLLCLVLLVVLLVAMVLLLLLAALSSL